MARSDDTQQRGNRSHRGRGGSHLSRTTLISKACSKLLRHQATNEGIPITTDGWVRLDHLLSWLGLTGRNGVSPPPTIEDIFSVVEDNEKKRFALRLVNSRATQQPTSQVEGGETLTEAGNVNGEAEDNMTEEVKEEQAENETSQAIEAYRKGEVTDPKDILIRAVQGHSIKTIAADTLLKPITLDDESSIPETCVHGTFYGAWKEILRSGGLKRMGRNHVHFAAGPGFEEVGGEKGEKQEKVISGMRGDAQLLIYVDLRRCLEDVKSKGVEMLWWRSENGVILTEGVDAEFVDAKVVAEVPQSPSTPEDQQPEKELDQRAKDTVITADLVTKNGTLTEKAQPEPCEYTAESSDPTDSKTPKQSRKGGKGKQAQADSQSEKLVPLRYWKVVVDIKGGHGVIWRQGDGEIKQLPDSLLSKGTPKYRGGGRGRGRDRDRGRGR